MINQQAKRPSELENSSMLSSNGFGRKIKISTNRPGSRDQRKGEIFPSLQDQLLGNPYNLELFNMYQDENAFASSIKAELLQIQEQINQLDLDGRLRNQEYKQEFRLQNVKKWLNQHSQQTKQLSEKISQQLDPSKIMDILNCKSPEESLCKLYRFVCAVDCIVQKVTEFELIHILKYDDIYTQTCQQQQDIQSVQLSKFNISFFNLERIRDFVQYNSKLNQKLNEKQNSTNQTNQNNQNNGQDLSKQISQFEQKLAQKDQVIRDLEKRLSSLQNNQQQYDQEAIMGLTEINESLRNNIRNLEEQRKLSEQEYLKKLQEQQMINQKQIDDLRRQIVIEQDSNHKLKIQIDELLKKHQQEKEQLEKEKEKVMVHEPKVTKQKENKDPKDYQKIIDQVVADYQFQIQQLNQDIMRLRAQNLELEMKNKSHENKIDQLRESVDQLVKSKDDIYDRFQKKYISKEEFSNSYEAALKLEFDVMKKQFESRIAALQNEQEQIRRDNSRQVSELKNQLQKEQETKKLLMNKLNLYT
ncbi:hypothetical protein pb186bvf_009088 [Paramecium bursaria]